MTGSTAMLKTPIGLDLMHRVGDFRPLVTMSEILEDMGINVVGSSPDGNTLYYGQSGSGRKQITVTDALGRCAKKLSEMSGKKGLSCYQANRIAEAQEEIQMLIEALAPPRAGGRHSRARTSEPDYYGCGEEDLCLLGAEEQLPTVRIPGLRGKFDPSIAY